MLLRSSTSRLSFIKKRIKMNKECQNSQEEMNPQVPQNCWSGNFRLFSDIFWCFFSSSWLTWVCNSLNSNETIYYQIGAFLGRAVAFFFMFFFWSWNREHLKCRLARVMIHILCFYIMVVNLFCLCPLIYFGLSTLTTHGWYLLGQSIVWGSLVAIKYKKIMWPKHPQTTSSVAVS